MTFTQGYLFEMPPETNTSLELKPCPFCGSSGEVQESLGDFSVHCKDCGCGTPWFVGIEGGLGKCIASWNKRKKGKR